MAKRGLQSTTQILTRSFTKGLNKDADPTFVQEGMWTHTRNAVNNTEEGNLGTISNEISNFLCATSAATMPANVTHKYIIGAVLLFSDKSCYLVCLNYLQKLLIHYQKLRSYQ